MSEQKKQKRGRQERLTVDEVMETLWRLLQGFGLNEWQMQSLAGELTEVCQRKAWLRSPEGHEYTRFKAGMRRDVRKAIKAGIRLSDAPVAPVWDEVQSAKEDRQARELFGSGVVLVEVQQ